MNNIEIEKRIKSVTSELAYQKGYVCSIDVLMKLGYLSESDYQDWRMEKVPYLEKVCKVNLKRLSAINKLIRKYATKWKFEKSFTYYHSWGKKSKTKLIFSKSKNLNIEEGYATHYLNKKRIGEIKSLQGSNIQTDNNTTNT